MNIESRSKKYERTDAVGLVAAVYLERPLVKIVTGHRTSDARAVCINGKWFVEAIDPLPERLEEEWADAL